jgi:hypothetical protein
MSVRDKYGKQECFGLNKRYCAAGESCTFYKPATLQEQREHKKNVWEAVREYRRWK